MAGVWIEQDENGKDVRVVSKAPARGVQLALDGQEVTPNMQARIDAVKLELSGEAVRGGPAPVGNVAAKPVQK